MLCHLSGTTWQVWRHSHFLGQNFVLFFLLERDIREYFYCNCKNAKRPYLPWYPDSESVSFWKHAYIPADELVGSIKQAMEDKTMAANLERIHNIYMDREEKPVKKVALMVIKGIEKFRFSRCCKSMPMLQKFVVRLWNVDNLMLWMTWMLRLGYEVSITGGLVGRVRLPTRHCRLAQVCRGGGEHDGQNWMKGEKTNRWFFPSNYSTSCSDWFGLSPISRIFKIWSDNCCMVELDTATAAMSLRNEQPIIPQS